MLQKRHDCTGAEVWATVCEAKMNMYAMMQISMNTISIAQTTATEGTPNRMAMPSIDQTLGDGSMGLRARPAVTGSVLSN